MSTVKVGVIGFIDEKHDSVEAWKTVARGFETVRKNFPNVEIEVVSSLVNKGVPQAAYYQAAQNGWKTTSIAPRVATEFNKNGEARYALWPVEQGKEAGRNWGDEAAAMIDYVDVLVSVGRNNNTVAIVKEAKRLGMTVHEYKLETEAA